MRRKTTYCSTMPSSATATKTTTKAPSQEPVTLGELVADIAAEQVERAMREVHVLHQAEDEREAGGDEKIERAEGDAVEDAR